MNHWRLRRHGWIGLLAVCLWFDAMAAGAVWRIRSRGQPLPLYAVWRDDAIATLVLYSGGGGGFGQIGADGWPSSQNFLIRSARIFAAQPVNLVLVGRPVDKAELDGPVRIGDEHGADNQAMLRAIRERSPAPIWLIGTSMGTISAAAAAIRDTEGLVSGVVLTSSVTGSWVPGAVPSQPLERIRVPVLVVHHRHDSCRSCSPAEARRIGPALRSAPVTQTWLLEGGGPPSGPACEPMHHHGFIGMEAEVVERIVQWVRQPSR